MQHRDTVLIFFVELEEREKEQKIGMDMWIAR